MRKIHINYLLTITFLYYIIYYHGGNEWNMQ